LFELNAELTGC